MIMGLILMARGHAQLGAGRAAGRQGQSSPEEWIAARGLAKGQGSLEALLALAALLLALAVLAHAAKAQSDAFVASVEASRLRLELARETAYVDMCADLLPGASLSRSLSGVPVSGGRWLSSNGSGAVREPLFHRLSVGSDGRYYVQE
jgi:hypothetical protein